jgi:hypothetical protein
MKRLADLQQQLGAASEMSRSRRSERESLHASALLRLQDRLENEPVVEQAKGIMVARIGCQPDEALGMMRRAAQQAHVELPDIAAGIVARAAAAPAAIVLGPSAQARPQTAAGPRDRGQLRSARSRPR